MVFLSEGIQYKSECVCTSHCVITDEISNSGMTLLCLYYIYRKDVCFLYNNYVGLHKVSSVSQQNENNLD